MRFIVRYLLLQMSQCALRWLRQVDARAHAAVSGLVAGCSMLWYPSASIALYMASKLLEVGVKMFEN